MVPCKRVQNGTLDGAVQTLSGAVQTPADWHTLWGRANTCIVARFMVPCKHVQNGTLLGVVQTRAERHI